jgi:FeS assembly SUF system regulator
LVRYLSFITLRREAQMIRLTRISDYGIVLMTQLAACGDREPRNARQVAAEAGLPLPVVRKILKVLTREGLLASHRGSKGGYSLARPPEQISAAEMIAALDGPISLTDCATRSGVCEQEESCQVREPWKRINAVVNHALASVTLAELAQPALESAAHRSDTIPIGAPAIYVPEHAEP